MTIGRWINKKKKFKQLFFVNSYVFQTEKSSHYPAKFGSWSKRILSYPLLPQPSPDAPSCFSLPKLLYPLYLLAGFLKNIALFFRFRGIRSFPHCNALWGQKLWCCCSACFHWRFLIISKKGSNRNKPVTFIDKNYRQPSPGIVSTIQSLTSGWKRPSKKWKQFIHWTMAELTKYE